MTEKSLREELESRDERILALELLLVDQASRLLAVEAIVANTPEIADVSLDAVSRTIASEGPRFSVHFESIAGFVERAQGLASSVLKAARENRGAKR
jgi:hypothetical protein